MNALSNCIDYGGNSSRYRGTRKDWEKLNGKIPKGMEICHRCDNPRCKNPDHWFLGTRSDNMKDCYSKGRLKTPWKNHTGLPRSKEARENMRKAKEMTRIHQQAIDENIRRLNLQ